MKTTLDIVVTGIGLTTSLGLTTLATWQKLMAGDSAIALRQPFFDLGLDRTLDPMPLAMAGKRPMALATLTQTLVEAAWADAGLDIAEPTKNCGAVVGSSRSHLQTWEAMGMVQRAAPGQIDGDWMGSLGHGPAVQVASAIGSEGPLLAPMAACATGIWAIAQGADLIRSGRCQRAVVGAVETPITPLTLAGFKKMGALARTGCYPFDTAREGFVLGEGGALLVLESAALAARRGARVYGRVLAAGITNDSHHVSAFEPSYAMGRRAAELCLQRSQLLPADIDAIHTHGTSTAQNDRMEACLIERLFGPEIPVMATKGATGHTLGASGAVGVALSLLSLKNQTLAPCVGLREADFDLNFVRAGRRALLKNALCFSFGFGGQNAILALSRWP